MNRFKGAILGLSLLSIISAAAAVTGWMENRSLENQLSSSRNQVNGLLEDIEDNSRQRLEYQQQIADMQDNLTMLTSQLTLLAAQLEETEQRINPDYEQMEQEIRERVNREIARQNQSSLGDPHLALTRDLLTLTPEQISRLMSIQGRFGGFLRTLNVPDERLLEIITDLDNLMAQETAARLDVMQRAQEQDLNRREIRQELSAVFSPSTQLEALSMILTEDELQIYQETQNQSGQTQFRAFTSGAINASGRVEPTLINEIRDVIINSPENGAGGLRYEILTTEPQ